MYRDMVQYLEDFRNSSRLLPEAAKQSSRQKAFNLAVWRQAKRNPNWWPGVMRG